MAFDTRRLIIALFLSLVLAGGSIGLVTAKAGDEPAMMIQVAAPKPGDAAEYRVDEIRVGHGIPGVALDVQRLTAEWLPAQWVLLDGGQQVHTRPLRVAAEVTGTGAGGMDYNGSVTYFIGADGPVAIDMSQKASRGGDVAFTPQTATRSGIQPEGWTDVRYYGPWWLPCGMYGPMHEGPVVADEPQWMGACKRSGGESFHYRDTETVAGVETARFSQYSDERMQTWFHPGFSLPIKLRLEHLPFVPSEFGAGLHFELTMVRQAVGEGDYNLRPAQDIDVPAVRLTPRTDLGPSTAGLQERVPLADAVAAALADDAAPSVQRFMETHPDTYLGMAWMHQYLDNAGRTATDWYLLWTDGQRTIQKIIRQDPQPLLLDGIVEPRLIVEPTTSSQVPADVTGWLPTKQQLPARMPSVASVLDAHDVFGQPGDAPLYWGFTYRCQPDCDASDAVVVAGVQQRPRDATREAGIASAPTTAPWVESAIGIDSDGRLTYTSHYAPEPRVPILNAAAPQDRGQALASPTFDAAAWELMVLPAAGATFAAVLVGILYYVWPSLRVVVFGFSRIHKDQVLRQPQRARIMEVIEQNPGIHFQEITRATDQGRGTVEHHLNTLSRTGHVVAHVGAGYTCYFAKGKVDRRIMAAAPLLKAPTARKIVAAIDAGHGRSLATLSTRAGVGRSTVGHHVKRLKEAGLVDESEGGYRLAGPTQEAMRRLA